MSGATLRPDPWAAQAALLRQPWQARRNRRSWRSLLLVTALAVGVALFLAVALRWGPGGLVASGGLVLLVIGWHLQVDGLLGQNHHALARLVPGHARALRRSLLVQGLAVTGAAALLLALGTSPQLRWLWLSLFAVVVLAWLVREPLGWAAFGLHSPLLAEWPRFAQRCAELPWGVQLVGLGSLVLLLAACAGQGGALHRCVDARLHRQRRAAEATSRGRPGADLGLGGPGRVLVRCFDWPQVLWRQRLIAAGARAPLAWRLSVGLGTAGTVALTLWLLLCFGLVVLGLMVVQGLRWAELAAPARLGVCIGLFSMFAATLSGRLERLWARRREQALLVLLPGCPRGAALRGLEARWRAEALLAWAGSTALALAVLGTGSAVVVDHVALVALLCLPLPWVAQWRARRLQGRPSPWLFGLWPTLAGLAGLAAAPLGITAAWSVGAALLLVVVAEGWGQRDPRAPLPLPLGSAGA